MGYLSNSDIETRVGAAVYVQLTDDSGSGVANEAVVDEARAGAEGEVDAHLARRYAVPIDLTRHPELSGILTSIALDLAEHRLRLRRPPVPQEATAGREAAIAWLKAVASAEIDLPAATQPAVSPMGGDRGQAAGADRVMTREELEDY
jgi:phage gp36-like protein